MSDLTHFDTDGNARMVDVGSKPVTFRQATARAVVRMKAPTAELIIDGGVEKGDVLGIARTAGIMGCKLTPQLIPLCHGLQAEAVSIGFDWLDVVDDFRELNIESSVSTTGKTGVEMEALTAVSISALTIYDMCKSVDRSMEVRSICLLKKTGGKSGDFVREDLETEN